MTPTTTAPDPPDRPTPACPDPLDHRLHSGAPDRPGRGGREPAAGGGLSWRVAAGGGELVVGVHPWGFVCGAGFPVRVVEGLGHPGLGWVTERMLATERRLNAERHVFRRRAAASRGAVLSLSAEERALARSCLKSVRLGVPLDGDEIGLLESVGLGAWARRWQAAVVAAAAVRAAARSDHAASWLVTRRRVAEAYDDESVRHATSLLDPALHQAIGKRPLARRPGDGTGRRSRLLTAAAHRHLRRLATAIDPAAFPGPTRYARLDPAAAEPLRAGGPPPITIGGPALARLRDALASIMPLCYLAALLAREDAREDAREGLPPASTGPRMDALAAVLRRLVSDAARHRRRGRDAVRLTARDVTEATEALWARAGERLDPCLPSVRLMGIGPDPAEATWLLSDVRDDRDTVYPCPPGERAVPVAYPAVDLGVRTPRIMIDDLVWQRARWRLRLPGGPGADAFDRWTALHRLRAEHGLPRHVVVHHPAEPAPVHVDLFDPLAVEDVARRDPAEVLVTEMLPAPGELWWRVAGEERCAELRLACVLRRSR